MVALYETRINERNKLYERVIAEKNERIKRFRVTTIALAIALVLSLIHSIYAIMQTI